MAKQEAERETLVIDAKAHVVGKLAAVVAKSLLEGKCVVVLRAEEALFSMPIERAHKIYQNKLKKRCLVNPSRGPFHHKEPSKNLRRIIRGMMNYKSMKGASDLARLSVFDGIPLEYEKSGRVVCTHALARTQLKPYTKRCTLGEVCEKMGWNNLPILRKFEAERQKRADAEHKRICEEQERKMALLNSEAFNKELEALVSRIE
jgi:large subunit ribosomal protein L13Ae